MLPLFAVVTTYAHAQKLKIDEAAIGDNQLDPLHVLVEGLNLINLTYFRQTGRDEGNASSSATSVVKSCL